MGTRFPRTVTDRDTKVSVAIPEPLEYGTINLAGRRPVKVSLDGKRIVPLVKDPAKFNYATLMSVTLGPLSIPRFPGVKCMVLVPSLDIERSLILSEEQALKKFELDGLHLGIFDEGRFAATVQGKRVRKYLADAYAQALSENEGLRVEQFLALDPTLKPWNSADYSNDPSLIMPSDPGFVTDVFTLVGIERREQDALSSRLTSLKVKYGMSLTTEITATYDDKDYSLVSGRYFDPRREYRYRGLLFEVVSVSSGPGSGGYPEATVTFAPKCVQELRRDKNPQAITATNGYEYARRAAARCGMNFVGEQSQKQQTLFKGKSQNSDESVWTVLTESGKDGQLFVFEVDNTLVYGTGTWLMWRFGLSEKKNKKGKTQRFLDLRYDPTQPHAGALPARRVLKGEYIYVDLDAQTGLPVQDGLFAPLYNQTQNTGIASVNDPYMTVQDNGIFELATWPDVRVSENDGLEAEGTVEVMSPNGRILRPGHTVFLTTVPEIFRGGYLVQDLEYEEFTAEPVRVSLLSLQKIKNQEKPETDKKKEEE